MEWSAEWPLRVKTTRTPSTISSELDMASEWCASNTTVTSSPLTMPRTESRLISSSRAASNDAAVSSRFSDCHAWTTL